MNLIGVGGKLVQWDARSVLTNKSYQYPAIALHRSQFAPLVSRYVRCSYRRPVPAKAARRPAVHKKGILLDDRAGIVFTPTSVKLATDKMLPQAIAKHTEKQKGFVCRNLRFANGRSEILVDNAPTA